MVVVTAVVLLMTALTVIFIFQGGLGSFMASLSSKGAEGTCLSKKDTYCSTHPKGTWKAYKMSYQGETCQEILEEGEYKCEEEKWVSASNKGSITECEKICDEYSGKGLAKKLSYLNINFVEEDNCGQLDSCKGETSCDFKKMYDNCKDIKESIDGIKTGGGP